MHSSVTSTRIESSEVGSADEGWGIVIDGFGLGYADVPADERGEIWNRVRRTHEEWEAAGRT